MINLQAASKTVERSAAAEAARPLDLVHLARMTFGDRDLEREVLQLFVRQSAQLVGRMEAGDTACAEALAHTLKGSARGLGAWRVAAAAEAVEQADAKALPARIAVLRAAVDQACAIIEDLLKAH